MFIVPLWCIYNRFCFHDRKRTIIYMIFGFYLTAVLALVGFSNIISLKVELTVNIIPFVYLIVVFVMFFFQPFISSLLWEMLMSIKVCFYVGSTGSRPLLF